MVTVALSGMRVSVPTRVAVALVLSVSVPTPTATEQTATGNHASASVLYASERRKIIEKKIEKFFKKLLTFPKICAIIYPEDEKTVFPSLYYYPGAQGKGSRRKL